MIDRMVRGALAGLAGTAAMAAFMEPGLVKQLPSRWRPDEFVPRQVVQWLESIAGRPNALSEEQEKAAAAIAHLGYGTSMGALYGLLSPRRHRFPAPAAGAAWGLLVWAAGYQGWLPAVGVRPPTTHQPPTKWPVPISNHLLFGIVTGLSYRALTERRRRRSAVRIRV